MIDPAAIVAGVVAWVDDVIGQTALGENVGVRHVYDHLPVGKPYGLPDAIVEVANVQTVIDDPRLPFGAIQNRWCVIYPIGLSMMVENDDPEAAAAQLLAYVKLLAASLTADGTLGGRVPFCSPSFTFNFDRPFVRYEDGTKGREATASLTVGDLMEVDE